MARYRPPLLKKLLTRLGGKMHATLMHHTISFQRGGMAFTGKRDGITVILNAYRRTGYMHRQVAALRAQTAPPEQIWIWSNDSGKATPDFSAIADRVIVSNFNWKFFGRFTLAGLAQTDYVAFLDDDILPQPMWFENCRQTVHNGYDGILGGSGVLLPADGGYSAQQKIGWNGDQLATVTQVDLVGHAWFARKQHYLHLWREEPYSYDNGEDIHLSYTALKYGGIKTFVPPHPADDRRQWSCEPDFGKIAGGGAAATYKQKDHFAIRDAAVRHYRHNGWQVLAEHATL